MKHHPTFLSALFVLFLTAGTADAWLMKGPYLQNVTNNSIVISWETDTSEIGSVEWGETSFLGNKASDTKSVVNHAVTVAGLLPGKTYYYKVTGDQAAGTWTFATAPEPWQSFSFAVFGDNRTNEADHRSVVNGIIGEGVPLLLNTGDMVDYGTLESNWQKFFDIEKELLRSTCFFPTIGNHEITIDILLVNYKKYFTVPESKEGGKAYYSFDYGNTHFADLNTNDALSFSTMKTWLEADLKAASLRPGIQHIFTVMHHGPYSAANHGDNAKVKSDIVPILKKYNVQMTFAGHDHDYERGEVDGLRYMVAGGGGAPLYSAGTQAGTIYSEKTLAYSVFTVNGGRVDGCTKKPDGTVIECFGWGDLPPPDAGMPDSGTADSGTADGSTPDGGIADASMVDAAAADAAAADAAKDSDTGMDSGTVADSSTPTDAGAPDASVPSDAATDSGGPDNLPAGCSCSSIGL
ncbi:MAG: metallophosphoesterase family protein [Myxococcota bacterium]|jgi:hypothetical protein